MSPTVTLAYLIVPCVSVPILCARVTRENQTPRDKQEIDNIRVKTQCIKIIKRQDKKWRNYPYTNLLDFIVRHYNW